MSVFLVVSLASGLRFLSDLRDSVVVQQTPASFHCHAYNDGRSQVVVRWFIDSVEIRNSSEHFLFDNGTLHFPSIVKSEAVAGGTYVYRCRVSDDTGAIVSREARVEFACKCVAHVTRYFFQTGIMRLWCWSSC